MNTFKKLFRALRFGAIKRCLRKRGLISPVGDIDLPTVKKGYDEKLGSCLELEYSFEITEQPSDDKAVSLGWNHVRVCMSVNSIILLALQAIRDGGRQRRAIDMVSYVNKTTLTRTPKSEDLGVRTGGKSGNGQQV